MLSAVLDAANDRVKGNDKATMLQSAWRRRNVQAKIQTAVGEMMEIDGLLEELSERERDLAKQQAATGLKIETAMKLAEQEEPPPSMPSEKDMKDPKKMQEYMLQVTSARALWRNPSGAQLSGAQPSLTLPPSLGADGRVQRAPAAQARRSRTT